MRIIERNKPGFSIITEIGRVDDWDLPVFFVVPARARAGLIAAAFPRAVWRRVVFGGLIAAYAAAGFFVEGVSDPSLSQVRVVDR